MIAGVQSVAVVEALAQRLGAAADALGWVDPPLPDLPAERAAMLLVSLPERLTARPGPELWLYLVAVLGRMPVASEVEAAARFLELDGPDALATYALDLGRRTIHGLRADLPMEVITDRVVISADYCARDDYHTGVQRVVRAIARRWSDNYDAVVVADIDERTGLRNLAPREAARVLHYGREIDIDPEQERSYRQRLIVPFGTTVVYPEVMHEDSSPTHLCLAMYSGNTTCAVGYDMIPILSSSLRLPKEPGNFSRYLSVVKHMTRVAAISHSAANEFQGFVDMLPAQGLVGPRVAAIPLATEIDDHSRLVRRRSPKERPLVAIPARLEAHKNVLTAVQAAHRLWQEGVDFELVLLGGVGIGQDLVLEAVKTIEAEGYPITRLGWVPDEVMWQTVTDAAFVIFISLHEGYGLPLVEAMSCGVPVLTSDFGSQAEIAAEGGCLTVDPRSLTSVADGMRQLITQPDLRAQLGAQIAQRSVRTWDEYAADVWDFASSARPEETA